MLQTSGGKVHPTLAQAAFTHSVPDQTPLPVLIAVPHAGQAYPKAVLAAMRDRRACELRLEDRHVDQLGNAAARATGCGLMLAHAPRAMIDLNRAFDDIDWQMVAGERPSTQHGEGFSNTLLKDNNASCNRRARGGLGLVPRRLPDFGEIWRAPLEKHDLDERVKSIHAPYHEFLSGELARIRDIWGAALLIDLHSMPPLRRQSSGNSDEEAAPLIVLGDRFGASCDSRLVARASRYLDGRGLPTAHNRPYSGGYVLDRHSAARSNIHGIQLEICRSTYLDQNLDQPGGGLEPMSEVLAGLIRELASETARLAPRAPLRQAAE